MVETFLVPVISLGGIGAVLASVLVLADSKLKVEDDPKVEALTDVLPGSNCGACGLPGCAQFAEAVMSGNQDPAGCSAGGAAVARAIGDILGIDVEIGVAVKARVRCLGGDGVCGTRSEYKGISDCRAAALVSGGAKSCVHGCLGYGSCVKACPFGAMVMREGLPRIDDDLCTGCGICVEACPRDLMVMVAEGDKVFVGCASPEKAKAVKEICARGCIGCSLCAKVCPREAIAMDGNLPIVDQEKCDACGVCIERCPTDSLLEPQINRVSFVKDIKKAV